MDERLKQILDLADNIVTAGNRAFISPELIKAVDVVLNQKYGTESWYKDNRVLTRLASAYIKIRNNYHGEEYRDDIPYL